MSAIDSEYVFREYQILWNHYHKTLEERNNMLKNYCLFIGVSGTVLALLPHHSILGESISGLFLIMITALGTIFNIIYVSECVTADRYLKKISEIRLILNKNLNVPNTVFRTSDTYNSEYFNIFNKVVKISPLCIINLITISLGLYFLGLPTVVLYFIIPICFVIQIAGYMAWMSRALHL